MSSKFNKKQILILVIIILLIAFIGIFISYRISNRNIDNIENIPEDKSKVITDSKQENRNLQEEVKLENKTYKDVKAWIKVPGTSIDSPVFQADPPLPSLCQEEPKQIQPP